MHANIAPVFYIVAFPHFPSIPPYQRFVIDSFAQNTIEVENLAFNNIRYLLFTYLMLVNFA